MILDEERQKYLSQITLEISFNPHSDQWKRVIPPPLDQPYQPSVFYWCPITQYKCHVQCIKHQYNLIVCEWNDNVTKKSTSNPRMAYDLYDNIVFVQRQYKCTANIKTHFILSSDKDIIGQLAKPIQARFPFSKYNRSMFTQELLDYIFNEISRGSNFLQIPESIAALHRSKFVRRECTSFKKIPNFHSDIMYSFPSRSNIIDVFLDEFRRTKHLYEAEMSSIDPGRVISADKTFEIKRKDGSTLQKQHGKLFVILNEFRQVIAWTLYNSTSTSAIEDTIKKVSRYQKAGEITTILLSDCCVYSRNLCQTILQNAEVKLDIFHVIESVIKHLPNPLLPAARRIGKSFGLVFREINDIEDTRKQSTASSDVILDNFLRFIVDHKTSFEAIPILQRQVLEETLTEIEKHIENGYMSAIESGWGKETANDTLNKMLDRTLLGGTYVMLSRDMVEAVLTITFHHYNQKMKKEFHECNKEIPLCAVRPQTSLLFPGLLYTLDLLKIIRGESPDIEWPKYSEFLWRSILNMKIVANILTLKATGDSTYNGVNEILQKELNFQFEEGDGLKCFDLIQRGITTSGSLVDVVIEQLKIVGSKTDMIELLSEEMLRNACEERGLTVDNVKTTLELLSDMLQTPLVCITTNKRFDVSINVSTEPIETGDELVIIGYNPLTKQFCSTAPSISNDPTADNKTIKKTAKRLPSLAQCRCGTNNKNDVTYSGCVKDRCPCNTQNTGCTRKCQCFNCGNQYGKRSVPDTTTTPTKLKRKRRSDTIYHKSGQQKDAANEREDDRENDTWNDFEIVTMVICLRMIRTMRFEGHAKNHVQSIMVLFNLIAKDHHPFLREKTSEQIISRI